VRDGGAGGRGRAPFWLQALVAAGLTVAATTGLVALVARAGSPPSTHPSVTASPAPAGLPGPGWRLTFSDEFDGAGLDPDRWIDSYPGGVRTHSNNERQFYASDAVTLSGGRLVFTATRRVSGAGMPYTSGMVSTGDGRFAQKYGWFEVRARLPKGRGLWPAFWLLPATGKWPPEIDVLEVLGHDTRRVYMTNHWSEGAGRRGKNEQHYDSPEELSADFHTYAVRWEPGEIVWYVDGVERARSTEHVPEEPMYVLANLAVGGDWPGMPDDTTPFPSRMEVEYVRVYARE
jgi:beta-glucanase (GH16 family)